MLSAPPTRPARRPTWIPDTPHGRWRPYPYSDADLLARDKVSLDLSWLRDEGLEDAATLPDPDLLAADPTDPALLGLGEAS